MPRATAGLCPRVSESPPPSPSDPAYPRPGWAHLRGAGRHSSVSLPLLGSQGGRHHSLSLRAPVWVSGDFTRSLHVAPRSWESWGLWGPLAPVTIGVRWRAPGEEAGRWALQRAGRPPSVTPSPAALLSCLLSTSFPSPGPQHPAWPGAPRRDPLGSALWPAGLRRGASRPGDSLTMRQAIRRFCDFGQIASHLAASIFNL